MSYQFLFVLGVLLRTSLGRVVLPLGDPVYPSNPITTPKALLEHRQEKPNIIGYYYGEEGEVVTVSCSNELPYAIATSIVPHVQFCPYDNDYTPGTSAYAYGEWPSGGCQAGSYCCPSNKPHAVRFSIENGNVAIGCGRVEATYQVYTTQPSDSEALPDPVTASAGAPTAETPIRAHAVTLPSSAFPSASATDSPAAASSSSSSSSDNAPTKGQLNEHEMIAVIIACAVVGLALCATTLLCIFKSWDAYLKRERDSESLTARHSTFDNTRCPSVAKSMETTARPPRRYWTWKLVNKLLVLVVGLASLAVAAYFGYMQIAVGKR